MLPVSLLLAAWVAFAFHPKAGTLPLTPKNTLSETKKKDVVTIRIYKSKYRLELYRNDSLLRTYPVVFGFNPVDDKQKQGDGCTPEGTFHIQAKYPHRSWSYFMWLDYPTKDSWRKFNENKKKGIIASGDDIGGEIGIHGVPFVTSGFGSKPSANTPHADDIIDKKTNWTLGCISLKTADISELYTLVPVGTEVLIFH